MRPRQPLVPLACAAVAGILLAEWLMVPWWAVLPLLSAAAWWRRTWLVWAGMAVVFSVLHAQQHYGSPARRLAEEAGGARRVARVEGVVTSEPQASTGAHGQPTGRFEMVLETLTVQGQTRAFSALVQVRWAGPLPAFGDRVQIFGSLALLAPPQNPGEFDYAAYQQRRGIYQELQTRYASDCQVLAHGCGPPVMHWARTAQEHIRRTLSRELEDAPEVAALIQSMVLGLRGETPEELQDLFRRTGTMHLFAVSGLNVMMLAALGWYGLRPLRVPRAAAVWMLMPLLAFYAVLTGLSASCVRACVMGILVLAAYLVDRRPLAGNGLAAAALIILAWDTEQLFRPGFQLSFVLVAVLLTLGARLQTWSRPWGRPDAFLPRPLWNPVQRARVWAWELLAGAGSVGVAAWVGSLPFTVWYFHLFSFSTVLANLVAVPLAFAMLALGLGAVLVSPVWNLGAALFNNANWLCAKALVWTLQALVQIPGGWWYVENGLPRRAAACELTALEVGGGGAVHVRAGGAEWLVDCGHATEYTRTVRPYLRQHGVNGLAGLLLTHGDALHLGAAPLVLQEFQPTLLVDSPFLPRPGTRRNLHRQWAAEGRPKCLVRRGDTLALSPEVTLRVLYPPADLVRTSGDDQALVLRLEAAGWRALLMSDAGFLTEQWLAAHEPDLHADILLKGEHAKDFSGTPDFLQRVAPGAIVCSPPGTGAALARYEEWLRLTRAAGWCVLPQAECGAVHVRMTDHALTADGFHPSYAFTKRRP